ncbi:MAG: DUF1697 domain-containing protein [Woeseia sp.]
MNTWIALFRGINVGGNNMLPMKELTTILESIGCSNVQTYIQSGNVVLDREGGDAAELAGLIGQKVLARNKFEPRVLLLTAKELAGAIAKNPYPAAEADPKSLHLFFLAAIPKSAKLAAIEELRASDEECRLSGRVFYLHAPSGVGRSKLAAGAEKLLGVDATARNWRTATRLLQLAKDRH